MTTMTTQAIGYIDPQSVRNMRNGTSTKEFVWPAPDTGLQPIFLNPLLSFADPDTMPAVERGGALPVWAAYRIAATGEVRHRAAVFFNEIPIPVGVTGDSPAVQVASGWFCAVPREDGGETYTPLLAEGDEPLGWTALPAWSDCPKLDGMTLLEGIRDRALAVLGDATAVGHDVAAQILSLVDAPAPGLDLVGDVPADEAFRRLRASLAFISVYEPDDHAKQSVQHMLGWAAVARRQADKALEMLDAGLTAETWQTIDQAPKDGRSLWVYNGEQGVMRWIEGDEYALWVWVDPLLSDVDPSPEQPTHFRRMMAPPSA